MMICMPRRMCTATDTISAQRDGDDRLRQRRLDGGVVGAGERHDETDRNGDEKDVGGGGEPLLQKCSAPSLAEPSPRARLAACGMPCHEPSALSRRDESHSAAVSSSDSDDRAPATAASTLPMSKPRAGVPDEVAHAAQHVVDQRPGVAEQHELADQVANRPLTKSN